MVKSLIIFCIKIIFDKGSIDFIGLPSFIVLYLQMCILSRFLCGHLEKPLNLEILLPYKFNFYKSGQFIKDKN
jgi:hypothetical protein